MGIVTRISSKLTDWVGTPASLVVHTIFFVGMFASGLGWSLQEMLLVLTTILSIEAIYLALFIQITVKKTSENIEDVEKDIDAIQEDERKDDKIDQEMAVTLKTIQKRLTQLQKDLDEIKV
jgi:low affinity Fe/Cu permease